MAPSTPQRNGALDPTTVEEYQILIQSFAQAFWETDPSGQVVTDSPSWRAYTGQSLEQWLGEGWVGAIHPNDRAYALRQWQQAVEQRQPMEAEFRLQSPDGGWRWTVVRATAILNPDGSVKKWLGLNIDISQKKAAEATLQQAQLDYQTQLEGEVTRRTAELAASQQLLQATLDSSLEMIQVFRAVRDESGQIVDFTWVLNNNASEQHYGDVIGKNLLTLNPGVAEAGIFDAFKRVVETGLPDQSERYYAHEQFKGWFYQSTVKLGDGVATTTKDITNRKQAEGENLRLKDEIAQRATDRYYSLFNSIDEGFSLIELLYNEEGQATNYRYTEVNQSFERQTGLKNVVGRLGRDITPADEPYWLQVYDKVAQTGEAIRFENYHQATGRWYESYASRVGGGASRQVAIVFNDITPRKQAEEALQEADRRKDEFLAMLAHELRNPMSTIRSGLQILTLTGGENETVDTTVAVMNRQTDHLVRLVDDLLDVSRISRGKIELKQQRLDLTALVGQAAEAVRPLYKERGRSLRVTLPATPIYVDGDATRLSQAVTNLLTNGARYTGEGGQVWLSLEHLHQGAIIQVRDNGIGLAQDQLSAIFELFVQVDNSLARSQGGLGLGLTLVKRLVEMHGGQVEAQSAGLGKGSTFTVHLPTLDKALRSDHQPAERLTDQPARHRILIIDDNPDVALTLSMLLKIKGYEVHSRNSGRAGLEAAQSLNPAVILLDIGMPEMDGYTTCRLLRQQPWGQGLIVVALSGYGQEDDKQRTREAGFDGHLVKPVDLKTLTDLLTSLLDTEKATPKFS